MSFHIKEVMQQQGVTATQLAKDICCARTHIHRIFRTVTYLHGYKKSEASHLGSSVLPFPSEYTAIIEKCNAKLAIGNEQKSEYVLTLASNMSASRLGSLLGSLINQNFVAVCAFFGKRQQPSDRN